MHDTTINKPIPVRSNPAKIENKAIPSNYLALLKRIMIEFARRSGLRINNTTGELLGVSYSGLNGPLRTNLTWNPSEFFPEDFNDTDIGSVSDTRLTKAQAEFVINKLLEICDIEGYAKIPTINTNNTTSITQVNATLPFPKVAGVISQLFEYGTLYGVLNTISAESYTSPTSSCRTGCTGLCYGSCAVNCIESCSSTCTGGCSTGCDGTCSIDCTSDCAVNCSTNCSGDCESGCDRLCIDGCMSECLGSCTTTCTNACKTECTTECVSSCTGECTLYCTAECSVKCTTECASSCTNACSGYCKGGCYTTCSSTCSSSCGYNNCMGACKSGCSTSCTNGCSGNCRGHSNSNT